MNKDKKKSGRQNTSSDKSEINDLNRKLKDLEDLCSKLKRSNDTMKNDYDKHKSKLTKVGPLHINLNLGASGKSGDRSKYFFFKPETGGEIY